MSVVIGVGVAALVACTETPAPKPPAKKLVASTFDPCEGSKAPWRKYFGPLKDVRCEQEQFLTMASIAEDLAVECKFCHVPREDDPEKFVYETMTPNKETAMWMSHTFMTGLKRKDGKPMTCDACHINEAGKPAAKFLGEPRDIPWAVEWMTSVMTTRFETATGEKLKCKSCHVGGWGTSAFEPVVIGKTDQVPHGPLPPPDEAVSPAPSASAAPSVSAGASASAPSASAPSPASPAPAASSAPTPRPFTPSSSKK